MDPYQGTQPTDPFLHQEGFQSNKSGKPRGLVWIAWLGIIVVIAILFGSRYLQAQAQEKEGLPVSDDVGELLMKLQSRYMLGSIEMLGEGREKLFGQAQEMLNKGTVGQRQRFVILASEIAGPFEARNALESLKSDIADPAEGKPPLLTTEQEELQELLGKLYGNALEDEAEGEHLSRIDALSDADRQSLIKCADWFGELALYPVGTSEIVDRVAITDPAKKMVMIIVGIIVAGSCVGILGFIGLILMMVLTFAGRIKSQMSLAGESHGIYAETFAVWMFSFFVLQVGVQSIVTNIPETVDHMLLMSFIAFFVSLLVLVWPIWRGISWSQVRRDIGWTTDRLRGMEPFIGIAGYAMALPILGIGVLLVFLLGILQSVASGPLPTFAPAGGPAHPIILNLANGDLWTYIQIYMVASIGAPVVEETMFRGVLYQHLRSASRKSGIILSIAFSTLLNTFIFAMIHPQGWIAIPALMALAIGFTLLREWRGTVIPSIFVHGISNGLVMTLLIVLL